VFATLNVKDKDNDVTQPGAFEDGAEVVISAYGHKSWDGLLPVGKGTIREVGDKVVMKGRFFLNTTAGRDTFEVVKELGARQEWSYGFKVEDSQPGEFKGESVRYLKRMKVYEVSPVLRGAGEGTMTTMAKADTSAAGRRREAANGEAEPDGSYPIRTAQDVRNAVNDFNRSHGTPKDRAHIIARARAIGAEDALPDDWRKSLNEEISFAVGAARDAVESAGRVAALRAEKGKELSQVNREGLDELTRVLEQLKSLLDTEVEDTKADDDVSAELAFIEATLNMEGE
jgi:hypothetical protein